MCASLAPITVEKERCKVFKRQRVLHDVLCQSDYEEMTVSSFIHQTQSKQYGRYRCVSIEGIELEKFNGFQLPSSLLVPSKL